MYQVALLASREGIASTHRAQQEGAGVEADILLGGKREVVVFGGPTRAQHQQSLPWARVRFGPNELRGDAIDPFDPGDPIDLSDKVRDVQLIAEVETGAGIAAGEHVQVRG